MDTTQTLTYKYDFQAYFISKNFDTSVLKDAVRIAENNFNNLSRAEGFEKKISVIVDNKAKCLKISSHSNIFVEKRNYLRSLQYFSKDLAKQKGLKEYIIGGKRLLTQKSNSQA